eukprot:scaffold7228_cov523-Prasinococcus_capsulatus_cf.AAC.20
MLRAPRSVRTRLPPRRRQLPSFLLAARRAAQQPAAGCATLRGTFTNDRRRAGRATRAGAAALPVVVAAPRRSRACISGGCRRAHEQLVRSWLHAMCPPALSGAGLRRRLVLLCKRYQLPVPRVLLVHGALWDVLCVVVVALVLAAVYLLHASVAPRPSPSSFRAEQRRAAGLSGAGSGASPHAAPKDGLLPHSGATPGGVVLSWAPRVVLFPNFVTEYERNMIIGMAKPRLRPSMVVSEVPSGEASKRSDQRTSWGAWLPPASRLGTLSSNSSYSSYLPEELDLIQTVEERLRWGCGVFRQRIANATMLPVENGECMYVLRYNQQEEYAAHHDYFKQERSVQSGGNRVATMVLYLQEPVEGGQTVFPLKDLHSIHDRIGVTTEGGYCNKDATFFKVKPKAGSAVFFWNFLPSGKQLGGQSGRYQRSSSLCVSSPAR